MKALNGQFAFRSLLGILGPWGRSEGLVELGALGPWGAPQEESIDAHVEEGLRVHLCFLMPKPHAREIGKVLKGACNYDDIAACPKLFCDERIASCQYLFLS